MATLTTEEFRKILDDEKLEIQLLGVGLVDHTINREGDLILFWDDYSDIEWPPVYNIPLNSGNPIEIVDGDKLRLITSQGAMCTVSLLKPINFN